MPMKMICAGEDRITCEANIYISCPGLYNSLSIGIYRSKYSFHENYLQESHVKQPSTSKSPVQVCNSQSYDSLSTGIYIGYISRES